ncbi:MAG: hypothetical protein PWR07_931 [Bacillota bacterium]|nr:hypothetical protein [Bacillota bacterium]
MIPHATYYVNLAPASQQVLARSLDTVPGVRTLEVIKATSTRLTPSAGLPRQPQAKTTRPALERARPEHGLNMACVSPRRSRRIIPRCLADNMP